MFKSIKSKIIALVLLVITLVSVTGGLLVYKIINIHLLKQVEYRLNVLAEKIACKTSEYLEARRKDVLQISKNQTVKLFLTDPEKVHISQIQDLLLVFQHNFRELSIVNKTGKQVALVKNGQVSVRYDNVSNEPYFKQTLEEGFFHEYRNIGSAAKEIVFVYRVDNIYDESSGVVKGTSVINEEGITGGIEITDIGSMCIMDLNATCLFSANLCEFCALGLPSEDMVNEFKKGKKSDAITLNTAKGSVVFSYVKIDHYDWFAVAVLPYAEALKDVDVLKRYMFIILLGLTILGIAIAAFLAKNISGPIKNLVEISEKVAGGDFSKRITGKSNDEIGRLSTAFNIMLEKLNSSFLALKKENEIRKTTELWANKNREFIAKVINSLEYAFYVIDTNYTVVMCNKAAEKKGIKVGDKCHKVTHKLEKPCAGSHICPLNEVQRTKQSVQVEHIHCDKDGKPSFVDVHGDPIFDDKGEVVQMIEYAMDITEKKKAEEALKNYAREINLVNQQLDAFTYIVSHDLKAPLRTIDAFSSFVIENCAQKLDEDSKEYLDRIKINAQKMQKLIDDLLRISRVGREKSIFQNIDVNGIIEEVKLRLEFSLDKENVKLIIKDKLPAIFCDKIRMTEVFANLISNAIKFMDKKEPVIEIGSSLENDYYRFYVKDNGIGIEEKHFDKIFQIFQRLNDKDKYEGTGAGLAIVKKIIQMHNGKIWVESKPGLGTTFYFTIPKDEKMVRGENRTDFNGEKNNR